MVVPTFSTRIPTSIVIILLLHYGQSIKFSDYNKSEPCDFRDSVNITSGKSFPNGSYIHDGTVYPKKYIGVYNYYYSNVTEKVLVQPYLRGCICKLKTCIQMCCENFMAYSPENLLCFTPLDDVNRTVVITSNTGNRTGDIKSVFGLVYGQPCKNSYFLEPLSYEEDEYELYENASIRLRYNQKIIERKDYCIAPLLENSQTVMYLTPAICSQPVENNETRSSIYGIALFLSIPFMILTIIIYMVIAELRNLHGKILCSYLTSLAFGYACLGYIHLNESISPGGFQCHLLGSLTYYLFMTAFFWLSINSFDLWRNFRVMTVKGTHNERRFIYYSIFAWGLALCFLGFVQILQNSGMPEAMKPGIGGITCFLNINTWMQMVYLYGPLLITISFNTTVFILTLRKIHQVNKELSHMLSKGESRKNVNREKAKILLYLRLFIIMGVTWMLEFISWLAGPKYEFLFYATDICNAIQGLLIFIFFVLRKRVKILLVKRYNTLRGIRQEDSYGNSMQSSTKVSGIQMEPTKYLRRESEKNGGGIPLMSSNKPPIRENSESD